MWWRSIASLACVVFLLAGSSRSCGGGGGGGNANRPQKNSNNGGNGNGNSNGNSGNNLFGILGSVFGGGAQQQQQQTPPHFSDTTTNNEVFFGNNIDTIFLASEGTCTLSFAERQTGRLHLRFAAYIITSNMTYNYSYSFFFREIAQSAAAARSRPASWAGARPP